jgi:hypothetical protein
VEGEKLQGTRQDMERALRKTPEQREREQRFDDWLTRNDATMTTKIR